MTNYDNLEIARLIVRKTTCGITEQEQIVLEQWLALSADNRALYEDIMSGESLRRHAEDFPIPDVERNIMRINKKISMRKHRKLKVRTASAMTVAAVVVLALVFGIRIGGEVPEEVQHNYMAIMQMNNGSHFVLNDVAEGTEWKKYADIELPQEEAVGAEDGDEIIINIKVPRGGEYRLELDDGTKIWLNADTEIEYPRVFSGEKREILLSGEAYFDVASDPEKPFTVNMERDMSITVHGTQFNVQTYREVENVYVTLVDGSVSVGMGEKSIALKSNQQAIIDRHTHSFMVNDIPDTATYTCWISGLLFFKQTPIGDIFAGMERWYDIDVVYDMSADISLLGNFTVKSSRRDNFVSILEALGQVTGLEYSVQERTVYIKFPTE